MKERRTDATGSRMKRKAETDDDKLYKAISILNEKPGSSSSVFTGLFRAIFKRYFNKLHASSCNTNVCGTVLL